MSANILSPEERMRLSTIPSEISDEDLVRFFTLSPEYLASVDRRVKPTHRLDQAARICILRWLGWSPACVNRLPQAAHVALCEQLEIQVSEKDLGGLPARTNRLHAQRAREYLGWQKYTSALDHSLGEWLRSLAVEHDRGSLLLNALLRHLYQKRIARPGLTRLERFVEATRVTVWTEIAATINSQLTPEQKKQLDDLLVVPASETHSFLQRLKETPSKASGPQLRAMLDKIEAVRAIGLDRLDLGGIHPNRVKLLAQRAKRRENWAAARLKPEQRYPLLVCFLNQVLPWLIDLAVQMHGDIIKRTFHTAEKKRNDAVLQRGQSMNNKVLLLAQLARLVLDEERVPDTKLRAAIYDCIPRDRLTHTVLECDEIAQPADYTPYTIAVRSYPHLRTLWPRFLAVLQFQAEETDSALLEAVAFMQTVDDGRHKFENPPLGFVPWRWKSYVGEEGDSVNRRMYELCLHDCLTKALDQGEVWAAGSQTYTSFRSDWISDEDWPLARKAFLERYPHLADVDTFLERARLTLDARMDVANRAWPDLQDRGAVRIDRKGKLHLDRLGAQDLPVGTTRLQKQLTRLFPRVGITQLLLEVNHWVGIDQLLTNVNRWGHPTENLIAKKLAAIMAEGMNIGLQNMGNSIPTMSYWDLAGVYERYIREETLRQAIVAVVNFYHRLPITRHWGDGTVSSSDGQLFGVPVRTIYSQYHPKSPSKSGRAINLYTHVSDHAIPFYGQVIHNLGHEGAYVLDGLLHHETDLSPSRHFADTGGYQDTLWGACHLLGFSLEPRIRAIGDMRLFRMRRRVDQYEHIQPLFKAGINTRVIRENWDDVLRLMASIYMGVVPASRVLQKLNAYHVESRLYKALREVGRIAKTSFLLSFFTRPETRRGVQVGLNRQESVHALSRSLFIGQLGEFRLRDLSAQLNRASCLQLMTAMVITWNAAYLAAVVEKLRSEGVAIADEQVDHILPVMSAHINLLGRYEFDIAAPSVQTDTSALPLRSMNEIIEQLGLGI